MFGIFRHEVIVDQYTYFKNRYIGLIPDPLNCFSRTTNGVKLDGVMNRGMRDPFG